MSPVQLGLIYCLAFVTLEAFQAVFFGSVFQNVDSFVVGAWVFGISVVFCTLVTAVMRPAELTASVRSWRIVATLNVLATLSWTTYFIAVQLIEPAVAFAIFSGMIPLGTVIGAWLGLPEARSPGRRLVRVGNGLILLSILLLAAATVTGLSGFVRGGWPAALFGVVSSAVSGGLTAFVIIFSVRLNGRGVGPPRPVRASVHSVHAGGDPGVAVGTGRQGRSACRRRPCLDCRCRPSGHRVSALSRPEGGSAHPCIGDRRRGRARTGSGVRHATLRRARRLFERDARGIGRLRRRLAARSLRCGSIVERIEAATSGGTGRPCDACYRSVAPFPARIRSRNLTMRDIRVSGFLAEFRLMT